MFRLYKILAVTVCVLSLSVSHLSISYAKDGKDKTSKVAQRDEKHSEKKQPDTLKKQKQNIKTNCLKEIKAYSRFTPPYEIPHVTSVCFSPDETKIASSLNSNLGSREVKIWDAKKQRLLRTFTEPGQWIQWAGFSPDGTKIAYLMSDSIIFKHQSFKTAKICDVKTGKVLHKFAPKEMGCKVAIYFGPDKVEFYFIDNKNITIYGTQGRKPLHSIPIKKYREDSLCLSANGSKIAYTSDVGSEINIWDTQTREKLHTLSFKKAMVEAIFFSPDGSKLAYTTTKLNKESNRKSKRKSNRKSKKIKILDTETGKLLKTLTLNINKKVESRFFLSPDGSKLGIASIGRCTEQCSKYNPEYQRHTVIKIWDLNTNEKLPSCISHNMQAHSSLEKNAFTFNSDGSKLISGSNSGIIRIWDLDDRQKQMEKLKQ